MTRAYIRLDPAFYERKIVTQKYPLPVAMALIGALCLAESQRERGRFRSEKVLSALLDRAGRHVAELIRRGDLVRLPDGRLYVDGWDEWQEGDWKVAERMQRIRVRKRVNGSAQTVTAGVSPPVAPVTPNTVYTPSDGGRTAESISPSGSSSRLAEAVSGGRAVGGDGGPSRPPGCKQRGTTHRPFWTDDGRCMSCETPESQVVF
jgi:hypothetical protein